MEIIRTPDELAELENAWAEAMDDGIQCASYMVELVDWLTNPDAEIPFP